MPADRPPVEPRDELAALRELIDAALPEADTTNLAGGTFHWGYRAGWNGAREAALAAAALAAAPPAEPEGLERDVLSAVEGTVRYRYSERDDCVCCVGPHVFGYWLEGADGLPVDIASSGWVSRALRSVPDGSRVRFTFGRALLPPTAAGDGLARSGDAAAAWEALEAELWPTLPGDDATNILTRHRPAIEAAVLRAARRSPE